MVLLDISFIVILCRTIYFPNNAGLLVCVDALRPSQQFFPQVGTISGAEPVLSSGQSVLLKHTHSGSDESRTGNSSIFLRSILS